MKTQSTVKLPYIIPDIKKSIGFHAGRRPYRDGGVRMEKTSDKGKVIYHDYGHGGAGISIAYGCSKYVIQTLFLQENVDKSQQIAVLGAGIIGYTTAYILIKMGYKVNVYADITHFERSKDKPEITSTVAAGYWMPLKIGNKSQTVAFATATWKHYLEVKKLQEDIGRKLGIAMIPVYILNDDDESYHFSITGVIEPKDCLVTFGDKINHKAKTFPTFIIEVSNYMNFLKEELENSQRYKFIKHELRCNEDIFKLKEKHIFNCLGLGAKEIFGDQKLRGIKGHILSFNLSDYSQVKGFLLGIKIKEGLILQVPHNQSGKLMIGVTFEEGKDNSFVQQQGITKVYQQARNFFLQVESNQISPKL